MLTALEGRKLVLFRASGEQTGSHSPSFPASTQLLASGLSDPHLTKEEHLPNTNPKVVVPPTTKAGCAPSARMATLVTLSSSAPSALH